MAECSSFEAGVRELEVGEILGVELDSGEALGVEGGLLSQLLHSPDYNLFPNSVVFESNFTQVMKLENWVPFQDPAKLITLGVTSTVPSLPLPNILLMAEITRPQEEFPRKDQSSGTPNINLNRILPLKFVELQIYDKSQHILRLRMVTEKTYYLKLHSNYPDVVFWLWTRLVKILQKGLSFTTKDPNINIPHCLVPRISPNSSDSQGRPESNSSSSSSEGPNQIITEEKGASDNLSQLSMRKWPQSEVFKTEWGAQFQASSSSSTSRESLPNISTGFSGGSRHFFSTQIEEQHSHCAHELGLFPREETASQWSDMGNYGLWERENPSVPQPLSLLSTLAASTRRFWPPPLGEKFFTCCTYWSQEVVLEGPLTLRPD
ncbi:protein FAM71F2-like isoform X2 [Tachyglossus aculeatus]|uniref:protein FAM71F2-like isoform X2 n=1 Tax=Tachyglossus aculeatus TaxID=9261 RepID=UPI0018F33E0E|nr:protein FAM71F2-like isoform X2 [Tachyglossus aculeatus]